MMKRYGFTVAEILVALTVIGVISALTIPMFTENTAKSQYITAFKTTMNQLQNGAELFKAEENVDFAGNRTSDIGQILIGRMLTTKLKAKTNDKQWQYAGIMGSDFYVGSTETRTVNNTTQYKKSLSGCAAGDDVDKNPIPYYACLGNAATQQEQQACRTQYSQPCWSTTDPGKNRSYSPYIQADSMVNEMNTTGSQGRSIGSHDGCSNYCDISYILPSGAVVSIYNQQTSQIPCNFVEARWNSISNNYVTPDLTNTYTRGSTGANLCLALVDVNGSKGPNRITSCTNATENYILNPEALMTCDMNKSNVNDIFPIFFYDGQVMPATAAAYTVLSGDISD